MSLDESLQAAMATVTPDSGPFPAKTQKPLYATYQRVTGRLHGSLNSGFGAERATFQIDVWGDSKGKARGLADTLKAALPGLLKVGELSDNPDDYEEDTKLHRASFDVVIWA